MRINWSNVSGFAWLGAQVPVLLAAVILATVPGTAYAEEYSVYKKMLEDRKAVYATVESSDILQARARIGGTVSMLDIDEGDAVEGGKQIALIGDEKLALRVEALDAKLASLRASRAQAKIDLDRAEELIKTGAVPRSRLDTAQTALRVADRELASMIKDRAVVVQQSKEGQVLAPGSGRVLTVHVAKGSVVMPGEPIATIASENYILRLTLPERHARFLEVGAKVLVGPRGVRKASNDALRDGKIVLVYPQINNGRVTADVTVDNMGDYFVGERTLVYVPTGMREAYVVPERFIYARYGLSYVKLADGTEVVVQAGQPVEGGIEILSGLTDGDVVVTP